MILRVWSPDYIVKSAIFKVWVFLAISMHEITLYAIDIHKNRFITPFLTLKNHFGKRTSIRLRIVQHPRLCHIGVLTPPHIFLSESEQLKIWGEKKVRLVTFTESIWRSDISIFNIFLAYFVKYLKTGEWRRILEHSLWFLLPQQIQNNFKICQKSTLAHLQNHIVIVKIGLTLVFQLDNPCFFPTKFCSSWPQFYG